MQNSTPEPMDASKQFCPNEACSARGQIGAGNIRIHSYRPQRYRCQSCKKTFSARRGTMMEGLRTPAELVMRVIILYQPALGGIILRGESCYQGEEGNGKDNTCGT